MSPAALASASLPDAPDRAIARLTLAQVPVLASSQKAIRDLGGRVTLSNSRIAAIGLADPGLALQLLREANVQAHQRRELEVASITHAVALLGMEQTLDFVARLRTLDSVRPRERRDGLTQALARAAYAAGLVREWTRDRNDTAQEGAVCATVLRHAAELAVWSGHTEAHLLFARLFARRDHRAALETELLGSSLVSLGERLAAEAHLPESLRAALHDSAALQSRLVPCVLASAVAERAARDWYDPRTLELLALHGELTGREPGVAAARVHAATARIARQSPYGAAMTAARYLLLGPGERFHREEAESSAAAKPGPTAASAAPAPPRRVGARPAPKPAAPAPGPGTDAAAPSAAVPVPVDAPTPRRAAEASTAEAPAAAGTARKPEPAANASPARPASAADAAAGGSASAPEANAPSPPPAPPPQTAPSAFTPASRSNEDVFRDGLKLLLDQRRGRATVQQVLPGVIDATREGLGFERAVFALINREKQCLQARYTSGAPQAPKLEVDIARANLLTQLMKTPQGLWVNSANRERLWRFLPRTVRAYAGDRGFCAMSLFVRDRPVGLLYADYEGNAVDERGYSLFKQVALELAQALAPARR